jgi:8-oxo-dGTP pyrophosphatase MutT (NUDIX family)
VNLVQALGGFFVNIDRVGVAYIINEKKQVLMLNHKKLNVWLPPGGHVEDNEFVYEAVAREVKEEAGIDIEYIYEHTFESDVLDERAQILPHPLFIQSENIGDRYLEDFIFLAKAKTTKIDNRENHEIKWVSFEDAKKLNTYLNVKKHLEYIQSKFKY